MQTELFRPQAIASQRNRLLGDVVILPTLHSVLWGALLCIWLLAAIAWLVSSHYARKVTVNGWLQHPDGVTRIYARRQGGRVKRINVFEGQSVQAGDTLVLMNGDVSLESGDSLERTLLSEYATQKTLLLSEIQQSQLLYEQKLADTRQQLKVSALNLDALTHQLTTLSARATLVQKRLQRSADMVASGHLAKAERDNIVEQQLHLKHERQQLIRDQLAQRAVHARQQTQLRTMPVEQAQQITALERQLSVLEQNITRLQGQRAYTLKAPISGIISNLQAKPGQTVRTDMPLLSIVPTESEIAATLTLPVKAAGFVTPGQLIDIRYDAFPYQKFGLFSGEIEQVTDSVLLPSEIDTLPLAIAEPVYLVRVKLDSQTVNAYGNAIPLKSGMTFDADIQLAERSMLEWLFEPLYSLRGRI